MAKIEAAINKNNIVVYTSSTHIYISPDNRCHMVNIVFCLIFKGVNIVF